MNQKETLKKIWEEMGVILFKNPNLTRVSQQHCISMVQLHNDLYGTTLSPHLMQDISQAAVNLKHVYHAIRRNELKLEDGTLFNPNDSIEEQPGEQIASPVIEEKVEQDISNPATAELFFEPDTEKFSEKYAENVEKLEPSAIDPASTDLYKPEIKVDKRTKEYKNKNKK